MRPSLDDVCGCFPTGRHYPGIAELIARSVSSIEGLSDHVDVAAAWAVERLAVIDFETTGLSPDVDRVLEVGVVCFERGQLTALKNWLVNPGIPVPDEARAIHNISDEEIAGAPPFSAIVEELRAILEGHLPVAYNAAFDRAFLHAELDRAGRLRSGPSVPPAFRSEIAWIDPLVWTRELHKLEKGHRLADTCMRLGIPLDDAHRAASDAEATGRVLMALAPRMPERYGELVRLQGQYAARQDVDMASNQRWRG